MFVHLAIHRPHPEKEPFLVDSMHRFAGAMQGQSGLQQVHTLKDEESGCLVGLAIWETEADWLAARPAMAAAVQDDPFDEWEDNPPEVLHLKIV